MVYKIKTMLKCLFIFVDQNETKRNVITLFRLVCRVIVATSPIAFRGGFPGKVRIPGAKYHVIGGRFNRGHEKQPAATVLK